MTSRARTVLLGLVLIYPFWLAMMAAHELGHVVGAITTGGRVLQVSIPLAGFSETIVHPNPWARVEVWCGPLLGGMIPAALWLALWRTRAGAILQAFAGWCLIANGAYLGLGWIYRAGDAGELVRLGTPIPVLIAFGTVSATAGLFLWHLLGTKKQTETQRRRDREVGREEMHATGN